MRTHYALRLLAVQLADAGFHVLRFDYHGTGDSAGEVGANQFDVWVNDVSLALRELSDISGATSLTIVGLRMGAVLATVALKTLVGEEILVNRLVYWDPVVKGRHYIDSLTMLNEQMISIRPVTPLPSDELLGTSYPPRLRDAIVGIDLAASAPQTRARQASLVVSDDQPEFHQLLDSLRSQWPDADFHVEIDESVRWDNLSAAFDARLTGPIVRAVAQATQGGT